MIDYRRRTLTSYISIAIVLWAFSVFRGWIRSYMWGE